MASVNPQILCKQASIRWPFHPVKQPHGSSQASFNGPVGRYVQNAERWMLYDAVPEKVLVVRSGSYGERAAWSVAVEEAPS